MKNRTLTFDIETYPNYVLFAFRDVANENELLTYEIRGSDNTLGRKKIKKVQKLLSRNKIITYNGIKFDEPVTAYALLDKTAHEIFIVVEKLINEDNFTPWQLYKKAKIQPCITEHIDIMDVARGSASLKLYGSRLGTKKLQDLPYEAGTYLTENEMDEVLKYCENDNILTQELYDYLETDLDLRESMSKQYGMNFMSFKGAKIAEMILVHETGYDGGTPERPDFVEYKPPKYINFETPELKQLFKKIKKHKYLIMHTEVMDVMRRFKSQGEHEFFLEDIGEGTRTKTRHGKKTKRTISDSGSVISPDFLDAPITFNGLDYKFGVGGLHASVESTTVTIADDEALVDIDYKSLYPSIIIENKFSPRHIGDKFKEVYQNMYDKRNKELKPAMKKVPYGSKEYMDLDRQQNTMKLVLNSSFGQTGQRFSKIYDPWTMLSTTLTGQLTLMMVVEKLALAGFKTFYANTDGITLKVKKKDVPTVQKITRDFDKVTGLEMEYNFFRSCHIRDVNNFVNITDDGKIKPKGAYANADLEKNVQTPIAYTAVKQYLLDGTPLIDTIKSCDDVKQFVSARTVTGGAIWSKKIPELYPEGWEASLTRNKRITKKMEDLKAKLEGKWVQENGDYLGKVVRWYYSTKGNPIFYKKSGNKVPKSEGAKPMMDLKKKLPKDLDYNWYVNEAIELLKDVGVNYDK